MVQPVSDPHDPDDEDAGRLVDREVMAERRARRAEQNEGALRERAIKVEAQLREAQHQLDGAHAQRAELASQLKQAERDLRTARQSEHAEARLRAEVEEDAAVARRRAEETIAGLRAALAAGDERVRELEDELGRAVREATQVHGASRAALAATDDEASAARHAALADADAQLAARLEEVRVVEQLLALGRRELETGAGSLELRLHDTELAAGDLEEALVTERESRVRAWRALEDERERAAAEVTLLQHELDRRASVQEEVSGQLVQLRAELEHTQARVTSDHEHKAVGATVLEDLRATALQLRDELNGLEDERVLVEDQLAAACAQVEDRDLQLRDGTRRLDEAYGALTQLRAELDAAGAELQTVRADALQDRARIDIAEAAITGAEGRARELAETLRDERDRRVEAEAALHLAHAEELAGVRATAEQQRDELERAVAQERVSFETQVAGVRDGMQTLRERLHAVEADADSRLAVERSAREEAERRADEEQARREEALGRLEAERALATDLAAAERQRAVADVDVLRARLHDAEQQLTIATDQVDTERARAQAAEREAGAGVAGAQARVDAAERVAATAQEQAATAMATRDALESELAGVRAQVVALEADRDALREELGRREVVEHEISAAFAQLRSELTQVRADADARSSRETQLEDLVNELVGTAASLKQSFEREIHAVTADRDRQLSVQHERFSAQMGEMEARVGELRTQLGSAAEELTAQLQAERARRAMAEEELRGLQAAIDESGEQAAEIARLHALVVQQHEIGSRAEERIVELEDELEAVRVTLRPVPPPADHPALAPPAAGGPDAPAARPAEADSVIIDLARAAARLRSVRPAEEDADVAADPDPDPEAAIDVEAQATGEVAPSELFDEPDIAADADAVDAPVSLAVDAPTTIGLPAPAIGRPVPRSWLTPGLVALARHDPEAANAIVRALIPVQAVRLRRELTYDLALGGRPDLRVTLRQDGTAGVVPRADSPAADAADFRLSGTALALAPLVGGDAGRRVPAGIVVSGRRRRSRRLAKAMRAPVTFGVLAEAGVHLDSVSLLCLVAGAIDPAVTAGERFTVGFAEDGGDVRAHVVVADGAPLSVGEGAAIHTAATVRTAPGALGLFLGGQAEARASGDAEAAARLLSWVHAVQGLNG